MYQARDRTASDRRMVKSGVTEGVKKHCQFSLHELKQDNTNMEPQAKKVMVFEAIQKKKHQLVKEKDTCSL